MNTPLHLPALLAHVTARSPDPSPLTQLSVAVGVAADAVALADDVVDHFVDAARRSGSSWTDVGAALGVSRQAAQQRFAAFDLPAVSCPEVTLPLTPHARRALRQARKEVRRKGAGYVDTEHLLMGLLRDPRVLAVKILEGIGITPSDVTGEVDRQLESKAVTDRPGSGMLPGAARAVQRAVAEAAELGHEYVGTEHLLLGLLAEPGAARDVITAFGGDYSAARNSALELLNGPHVGMRRGRARASLR